MNCVQLIGTIGQDLELRRTGSGKAVVNMRVAINEGKDRDATWLDVVAWDRQAELCAQFLSKGKKVAIEGRLSVSGWETREGEKRTKLEVVAFRVEFLSPRDEQQHADDHDKPYGGTYGDTEPTTHAPPHTDDDAGW